MNAAAPGPVRLTPAQRDAVLEEIRKDRRTLTVGRAPDNDLRVDDAAFSAHHRRVRVEGDQFRVDAVDPKATFTTGGREVTLNPKPDTIVIMSTRGNRWQATRVGGTPVRLEAVRLLEPGVGDNFAYNPACAYSDHYNCPIPPRENVLPVAIRAGEMDAHDH